MLRPEERQKRLPHLFSPPNWSVRVNSPSYLPCSNTEEAKTMAAICCECKLADLFATTALSPPKTTPLLVSLLPMNADSFRTPVFIHVFYCHKTATFSINQMLRSPRLFVIGVFAFCCFSTFSLLYGPHQSPFQSILAQSTNHTERNPAIGFKVTQESLEDVRNSTLGVSRLLLATSPSVDLPTCSSKRSSSSTFLSAPISLINSSSSLRSRASPRT